MYLLNINLVNPIIMKKLILSVAIFVTTLVSTYAQTADEVINKYLTTIGGKEKINAVKSINMETVVNYGGMEIPVIVHMDKEGKMLVKVNFQGNEFTQMAFDGTTGWMMNQMTMKAEKMESETIENMKNSTKKDFFSPFLNYKENGYKAEYIGKETKEGTLCHKIKLTQTPLIVDGASVENVSFYYFDAQENIIILSETEAKAGPNKGTMISSPQSNYQEVNGIYFPFTVNMEGQDLEVKKITLNTPIDVKELEFKAE
jgi:hypothetical protein